MLQMAALLTIAIIYRPYILKSFHDRDLDENQLQQLPPRVFDHNTKLTEL